jgi:hypothetical protein
MESLTVHRPEQLRCVGPEPLAGGFNRRTLLQVAGLGGAAWLTVVAHLLAAEHESRRKPAQSIILLWLAGGPSQLDTFDPHPGRIISGPTRGIETALRGIQLAEGLERVAEQMASLALVRSLQSKEGDHERGTYLVKTGYRPDPTVVHPSLGAICCHELSPGRTEIPRHISILPGQWPGRGGFLGDQYDAFKTYDPRGAVPDVTPKVGESRMRSRLEDLEVVERAFSAGRTRSVENTRHEATLVDARRMMTSEQLRAFDVNSEPAAIRTEYGDTAFGRGCLAARRLIEVGVRCVEVTLGGWDTHANNFEGHRQQLRVLDPALSALISDLRRRDLLDSTIVMCGGEFGRTPTINRLDGRDHWPHGFSMLLAGGGLRGGAVVGATDPDGGPKVAEPHSIGDVHATVLTALGINPAKENISPAGRPIKLADGTPIPALFS